MIVQMILMRKACVMGFKNYDKYLYKKVIIVCTDHKEFIGDVVSVEGAMNLLNSLGYTVEMVTDYTTDEE